MMHTEIQSSTYDLDLARGQRSTDQFFEKISITMIDMKLQFSPLVTLELSANVDTKVIDLE